MRELNHSSPLSAPSGWINSRCSRSWSSPETRAFDFSRAAGIRFPPEPVATFHLLNCGSVRAIADWRGRFRGGSQIWFAPMGRCPSLPHKRLPPRTTNRLTTSPTETGYPRERRKAALCFLYPRLQGRRDEASQPPSPSYNSARPARISAPVARPSGLPPCSLPLPRNVTGTVAGWRVPPSRRYQHGSDPGVPTRHAGLIRCALGGTFPLL
jgi:hypothetical protein